MARTTSDVVTDARRLLQDEVQPFRYPVADLTSFVGQAVAAAYRLRPDLMVGKAWRPEQVPVLDTPLPQAVDDWFFTAIVHYVVGTAESRDDQFAEGSRAAAFLTRFQTELLGQGI
jgi:hypothetical protein